jgi:hypothetical protein
VVVLDPYCFPSAQLLVVKQALLVCLLVQPTVVMVAAYFYHLAVRWSLLHLVEVCRSQVALAARPQVARLSFVVITRLLLGSAARSCCRLERLKAAVPARELSWQDMRKAGMEAPSALWSDRELWVKEAISSFVQDKPKIALFLVV